MVGSKYHHSCYYEKHMHMYPALHLEKRKEEASIRALMWDWRLREVQRPCQVREQQREWAGDGGGRHGKTLTRIPQGKARRLIIRTQANEVQGHTIDTNAPNYSSLFCWSFTIKSNTTRPPWSDEKQVLVLIPWDGEDGGKQGHVRNMLLFTSVQFPS